MNVIGSLDFSLPLCAYQRHTPKQSGILLTKGQREPACLPGGNFHCGSSRMSARCFAANRSRVVMTLISGSLSSYDDPLVRKIDPAPAVFNALCLLHGVLGLALIAFPSNVLSIAYNASPGNTLVSSLAIMMGGIHLYASMFSHTLKSAAENSRLYSNTYQRLAFGLGAWSFASMLKIAFMSSTSASLTAISANSYALLFALTLGAQFVCAKGQQIDFVTWNPLRFNMMENVYGFGTLFALLGTLAVWIQAFFPESFLGAQLGALSWIIAPAGALGRELLQFLSAGGFLLFSAFTVLLDASKRGRLGASTFKALNFSTGMLSFLWGFCLYRMFSEGTMKSLLFGEVFANFGAYTGHLMDIFTFKASLIFPLLGVACFIQYLIANK